MSPPTSEAPHDRRLEGTDRHVDPGGVRATRSGAEAPGWTIGEIVAEVGYHPPTVSKWLKSGGPPASRRVSPAERVIDERLAARIDALIAPPSKLLATSVFEIIAAEGYPGSYPSVVRYVRARRGPRFRVAPQVSVPIETGPGEEIQFDFSDCSARAHQFGLGESL